LKYVEVVYTVHEMILVSDSAPLSVSENQCVEQRN
jgi:hypothetical protein